jgi:hypothetical protein
MRSHNLIVFLLQYIRFADMLKRNHSGRGGHFGPLVHCNTGFACRDATYRRVISS